MSASNPIILRTDVSSPAAGGGVCGKEKLYSPITIPAAAATFSGISVSSAPRTALTKIPATIHPMVPKTRTTGNCFS